MARIRDATIVERGTTMPTRIAALIATTIVLGALCASAQEAAPPARQVAPAPEAASPAAPVLRDIDLALYAEYVVQANVRSRQIEQLYRVMDREGDAFSQEKYDAYRNRQAGGTVLVVLGACSVFGSLVTGIALNARSGSSDEYDDGSSVDESRDTLSEALPLGLLFGGIASIGIGVPLAISGAQGKHRQEILRRRDDILAPYAPPSATVSLSFDPDGRAGGLRLSVTF
jgi:hypothetical protein